MVTGFRDQGAHLRMALAVVGTFDEHEARDTAGGRTVELNLCGRESGRVLPAILIAQDGHIHVRAVDFREVDFIGAAIGGRKVLEEERVEVTAEQGVAGDVVAYGDAFGLQLLLHAADENRVLRHGRNVTLLLPALQPSRNGVAGVYEPTSASNSARRVRHVFGVMSSASLRTVSASTVRVGAGRAFGASPSTKGSPLTASSAAASPVCV